jgi:hypothetical protein
MKAHINKLFIIGNGFDLAHGLKTQYSDFINDLWEKEKQNVFTSNNFHPKLGDNNLYYKDEILHIITPKKISDLPDEYLSKSLSGYQWFMHLSSEKVSSGFIYAGKSAKITISIKNAFLEHISKINYNVNWVDIEVRYYELLKKYFSLENQQTEKYFGSAEELNSGFLEIRNLLEAYLSTNANNRVATHQKIISHFDKILDRGNPTGKEEIHKDDQILFLNFNYTNTLEEYFSCFCGIIPQAISCIHIHGELNNPKNSIIFGYGDEIDENYLKMENKNDNRYLENVKSMKYLQTPNYRNLLTFIEAYDYEVFIMGHSCGISDRTLLNTIFENKNCRSIKIFYYNDNNGKDDYAEKIMNIYRNFKDKPSMRAKVIDKTNCEPLI